MKKLEDYKGQKIAIRCKTYDEIRAILKLNNSVLDADSLIDYIRRTKGDDYKFCYRIDDGYSKEEFYINQGYTILPATDFLEDEFIYGKEYEFSDDEDFKHFIKAQYLCKAPNGMFISWCIGTHDEWKYARKINTERNEAITTIKELVSKHSINQNEVF